LPSRDAILRALNRRDHLVGNDIGYLPEASHPGLRDAV